MEGQFSHQYSDNQDDCINTAVKLMLACWLNFTEGLQTTPWSSSEMQSPNGSDYNAITHIVT